MASVEELLVNSLGDLGTAELKVFKWHLKNNHEGIPRSEMENADILDTVDKMVACFGQEGAVENTVKILRKMNQNNLAAQLESKHKKVSLRDINQSPEGNTSDTHTAGFSKNDEPCLNTDADKARYFDKHWSDLIQGVTDVQIIADKLCQKKLIHEEQYSEITESSRSQEGMRKICNIIRKRKDPVKAEFISILQEEKLYDF